MDEKNEAFLAKLRETFRVEAAEHIEAITAGLLAIDCADDAERTVIVERIFREAHSFKGAARSVSLGGVEALCRGLETIFAAMKGGGLTLSTEMLDAIHSALGVLATSCRSPGAPCSPDGHEQEQQAGAALERVALGAVASRAEPPTAVVTSQPRVVDDAAAPATAAAARPPAAPAPVVAGPVALDTVRVSARKLGAILLDAETLVGAKLAARRHAAELRALCAHLASSNQRRGHQAALRHRNHGGSTAPLGPLEAELKRTTTLERSLWKLAGSAYRDALSLASITDRLLESSKQLLLVPCSYLFGPLPKIVRDLAHGQGKEADLLVSGEDIEVDRRILDELKDPLIHLLRNCVDHGLETPDARTELGKPSRGRVTMTAKPVEGDRIELTVADDGRGIDAVEVGRAAVRMELIAADQAGRLTATHLTELVSHSGLSTSPTITDLSGRGLGLAIVREKVEKLGGTLTMSSTPRAGTTFRLLMPLSLAAFRGVLVEVAGQRFVVPTANVVRVGRVRSDEIKTVENRMTINMDGHAVSLVRLRDVLELPGPDPRARAAAQPVVLVCAANLEVAFLVDEVHAEQEVMVKSLGPQLARVRNIAGAFISDSGLVVPILNVVDLVQSASTVGAPAGIDAEHDRLPERRARLLIAEDSITSRTLLKGILEGAGYEVLTAVDGREALDRLETEPFDLLVSDVDMPRLNGFELTAKIRANHKLSELPVVLVTALGSQQDREHGIDAGANAYVVKSDFDQSDLLEILRRLL